MPAGDEIIYTLEFRFGHAMDQADSITPWKKEWCIEAAEYLQTIISIKKKKIMQDHC